MTLDEQIIACARANGYDGKGTNVIRPIYSIDQYNSDMGEWWIENGNLRRRVTDEEFKQWQRDYKLKKLLKHHVA